MRLVCKSNGRRLYRVARENLPSHTYIISNPDSRKIHFDPTITDFKLYELAACCNETFLRFAKRLGLFSGFASKDVCELILLTGGFYYFLNRAFHNVFGYSLPASFIGVRRVLGEKPRGMISYDNLEATPRNGLMIVGDTIATGVTLIDSIGYYLHKAPAPKRIVVFTIAGALPGARRLAELEKEIWSRYETELHVFFSDGIFGLAENQTDMFYFHPDSILAPESKSEAEKKLGIFLGSRMCAIWDWGQRNKNPIGHLQEVIRVCGRLGEPALAIIRKAEANLAKRRRRL